jgi:hypothetical protein
MARHLVESEFEVIPSDGAVEVLFIPTSSHYTFSRLSNRRDIAEFGLLSPDPRVRHASSSNYGKWGKSRGGQGGLARARTNWGRGEMMAAPGVVSRAPR